MNLNLHIIREELAPLRFKAHYTDDLYTFGCTYPLPYRAGMALEDGPVLLAAAEDLPDLTGQNAHFNLICIKDPQTDYLERPIDMLVCEDDVTVDDLLTRLLEVFQRYYLWEREMHDVIDGNHPVKEIGTVSQPIIGNPLLFSLTGFKNVFHNADSLKAESPSRYRGYAQSYTGTDELLTENSYPPLEVINDLISDPEYQMANDAHAPTLYSNSKGDYPTLYYNIGQAGHYFGRVLIDGVQHPFTERDFAIIKIVGDYIALAMGRRTITGINRPEGLDDVLGGLLSHRLLEEHRIETMLASLGWGVDDEYFCMVLESNSFSDDYHTLETLAQQLTQQLPSECFMVFQGKLIYVFNLAQTQHTREEVLEYSIPLFRDNLLNAGISLTFHDFKDLYYFYLQARSALSLGKRADPTWWYFRYDDFLLEDMAQRVLGKQIPEALYPRGLQLLIAYDEKHSAGLTDLLRTYLRCGMSVAETTRRSYIHRNTCLYRLNRIREISHIDLDNPRSRLELEMAFAIMDSVASR